MATVSKVVLRSSAITVACLIILVLAAVIIRKHYHPNINVNQNLPLPETAENIKAAQEALEPSVEVITTQPGDTISSIFHRVGISSKTLQKILADPKAAAQLKFIKPKQQLQFLITNNELTKLIIQINPKESFVVYKDLDVYKCKVEARTVSVQNHYVTATIHGSLFSTAKNNNIPYAVIQKMTEIFNWEINFARDIRDGDQFTLIYKAYYIENTQVGTGDLLAVTFKNRGKTFQAVKHSTNNSDFDYFTLEGKSLKKAFSRYPLKFSHISSTFSLSRMHPILKRRRPHKGIDLAAPIGTPIYATGDGHVEIIAHHNGYGNVIKIKHNNEYSSVYAHLLKFQKGLSSGSFVRRGQVIGYVGQSGLASGPHCHYEFHVNKQPKNPTTIELPHAQPIPTHQLAEFQANAQGLFARMKLYEDAQLASLGKQIAANID